MFMASAALQVATGVALLAGGVRLAYLTDLLWGSRSFVGGAARRLGPLSLSLLGMGAAAVLHSSSAVSLMALSWVQSGLLTTFQGLAVVLGASVGTTATAQTMARWDGAFLGSFIAGFALLSWLWHGSRWAAPALLGWAAVVQGVELLASGVLGLAGELVQEAILREVYHFGVGRAFMAGWLVTAVLQSSTLVTATVMALAAMQLVEARTGVALVLGSNVGTVTTALLVSLLLGGRARRLAVLDLITNLAPGAVLLAGLDPFVTVLQQWDPRPERVAANAHTLFNLATWALFLPWVRCLARWVDRG